MRKIVISLITLFWVSVFAVGSASAAGIGLGGAGHWMNIDADGSETVNAGDGGTAQTEGAGVNAQSNVPSYYLELTLGDDDAFAIGYEAIPGSADVSDKTHTRTDTETSVTSTAAATSNTRVFTADAEVEDFKVIYAEVPLGSLFYVRAGVSEITVNTMETASGNGGNYGNATLDGVQYGLGVKGVARGDSIRWKAGWEMNDFDTLNLTSSGNSVTAETNTLTANLDTWAFKFGIGLQF
jgi:hypothetical protein